MDQSTEPDAPELSTADFRMWLGLFWSHKLLILACGLLGVGGVFLWTMQQPESYRATVVLEYDPTPPRPLGSEVGDETGRYWLNREFFQTQNEILVSRSVVTTAARELGLATDNERQAVSAIQSQLTVEPDESTRLVKLHVDDPDPERAAALANAVTRAYVARTHHERSRTSRAAQEWLTEQLGSLRARLSEADHALLAFKTEHRLLSVSLEDSQNLVAAEVSTFHEAYTAARTERVALRTQLAQLRRARTEDPVQAPALVYEDNQRVSLLRSALFEKIQQRAGLATRYGPNHQSTLDLDGEIATLREQLSSEIDATIEGVELRLRRAEARIAGFDDLLEGARSEGLELNLREIEYAELERTRSSTVELYDHVLQRSTETRLLGMLQTTHVSILDEALVPTAATTPTWRDNLGFGFLGGLVFGFALALLAYQLDRRVRDARQLEAMGLAVLGTIPRADDGNLAGAAMAMHRAPRSRLAEQLRILRTNVTFATLSRPDGAILVTSASAKDGKTTIACNLAIALAQRGKRVLLVDTDLRRPCVHKMFEVPASRGVTSVLLGDTPLEDALLSSGVDGLSLMPCGPVPPNPAEVLHSEPFLDLLAELRSRYDVVVFDSPPLGPVTDAAILAGVVDASLLVCRAGVTSREDIAAARATLMQAPAPLIGCVLNGLSGQGSYGAYDESYYADDIPAEAVAD